ncbi:MAG: serine hydrolase domain-containing protein [Candidatus Binatia bacterium]
MGKTLSEARCWMRVTILVLTLVLLSALSTSLLPPARISGELFAAGSNPEEAVVWPDLDWEIATPSQVGMDTAKLAQAQSYALKGGGSGYIIRRGRLVWSWGNPATRYELKSTTKSIGVTGLGLAIQDGRLDLDDFAQRYHWSFGTNNEKNHRTGWLDDITIRQLATHTAGFEKAGTRPEIIFPPGTAWAYSDAGTNWLADLLTLMYQQDLKDGFFTRIFTPLGISAAELSWRNGPRAKKHEVQKREFGSGISASVNALARIGYLYLRAGRWRGEQLIPQSFVAEVRSTQPSVVGLPELFSREYGNASDHYGLLWWNNADGALENVPRDAYWSWGLKDSLIIVIPSLDLVIARAGDGWRKGWDANYDVLRPFIEPIVGSVH